MSNHRRQKDVLGGGEHPNVPGVSRSMVESIEAELRTPRRRKLAARTDKRISRFKQAIEQAVAYGEK